MTYEKPELLVLSAAVSAVRTQNGTGDVGAQKVHTVLEHGTTDNDGGANNTSSTTSAYEADE